MDVVELREQLVHANVTFSTEIADLQEDISTGLTQLMDIIGKIIGINFKISDYIKVSLIPPIVLMIQLIEATLSSVGNIAGSFQNMKVPFDPYSFLKQYVPYVDWETMKKDAQNASLIDKTNIDLSTPPGTQPGGM